MHQSIGRARVAERIQELNSRCKDGLAGIKSVMQHTPHDPALSTGICCFEVEGQKPDDVVKQLLAHKIIASSSPYAVSYGRLPKQSGAGDSEVPMRKPNTAAREIIST